MSNDEVVLNRFVVNKIWQVAQACVDETKKGWFVKMPEFGDALDSLDFTRKEVRATLAYLEARIFLITFLDADGSVTGISLVPQRYQCQFCNMWLNSKRQRNAPVLRRRSVMDWRYERDSRAGCGDSSAEPVRGGATCNRV